MLTATYRFICRLIHFFITPILIISILMTLHTDLLENLAVPDGAFLYADPIAIPTIPNTDFLFN